MKFAVEVEADNAEALDTDGNNRTTLLGEAGIAVPSACGTRYLVFSWIFRRGTNATRVWRTDEDGSNPVLTEGKQDFSPVCSVDLKWVYYSDGDTNQFWRVPLNGGKPELVPEALFPIPWPMAGSAFLLTANCWLTV